jgi:putative ABC transport system permease protein
VIIMVAMGEGTQRAIEDQMTAMGTNILQISYRRVASRGGQTVFTRASSFSKADLEKLRTESSFIKAISGYVVTSTNVYGNEGSAQIQVQGVEPGYAIARNWNISIGYFFDDDDLATRSTVAVLGNTTAENLFGDAESALFERVRIGTNYYTVIGILESKGGGLMGGNMDDVVMVPLDTAMTRLSNTRNINNIFISVISKEYMDAAQKETELILRESRGILDGGSNDFVISNQADMIDMASEITRTLTALLAAIAGVSLLVGGIGIMNIMLVSVTERTREIGIRMAVGGRKRDILFQFLAESAILSLLGGVLGIGMASLVCSLANRYGVPAYINPLVVAVSALFAAGIGIIFGYYPALKAARLYPIDALRYE